MEVLCALISPLAILGLALLTTTPGPAVAEQPMDRFERMIEQRKAGDVVEAARKWLSRNDGDRRVDSVLRLLDEASWLSISEDATVDALKAYRAEFPNSDHASAARDLESSLVYYAAIKDGSEDAFRAVIDAYAGTRAATDALEKAAAAGFSDASALGTSEAWSLWLSRYPTAPQQEQAADALHTVVWAEAEATGTAEAWLDLRAQFPDHPRADEARENEATLAMAGVSTEADLLALAARYRGTSAGRSALRRAVFQGEVLAMLAGSQPLSRDEAGVVIATLTESRATVGKMLQARTPLPGDTLALWLAPGHPLPSRVLPQWMRTGLEPASPALDWMRPAEPKVPVGPGADIDASVSGLGLRAEGFGNLEVDLTIAAKPAPPAAGPPPDWCAALAVPEGTPAATRALLREWLPCGPALVSPAEAGYWMTTPESLQAGAVPVGPGEPRWSTGCAAPGPIATNEASASTPVPVPDAPAAGDDDDSAAPTGPLPGWLPPGTVTRSEARDLDGDGIPEGLHLIESGGAVVVAVVDGRELSARVFEWPADAGTDGLLATVSHDGCGFKLAALHPGGEASPTDSALQ